MKKFMTRTYINEIHSVDVVRETAMFVIRLVRGRERRDAKTSDCDQYHDSWDAAHAFLLARADRRLNAARRALQLAQSEYGNVKGMKKPEDA